VGSNLITWSLKVLTTEENILKISSVTI